jgi:hypothetical protein
MANAMVTVGYLESVYKVRVFVIPAEAGMTESTR